MEEQSIIFTSKVSEELNLALGEISYDKLLVVTDEMVKELCLSVIETVEALKGAFVITIKAGDSNKTLDSLKNVWQALDDNGATRQSLLINLGGGMVTDLGGFAAATFKRGICFLNIPTTLLSMVDASVGGKTGINFGGLKNELGAFRNAEEVIIDTCFLHTLDTENICSGFAEMIKHGLLSNVSDWAELMNFDLQHPDWTLLSQMIEKSVSVKKRIVKADPEEHGLRKALNFGHTVGHAFESLSLRTEKPILHGYAVAYGMVCELYLSAKRLNFPHDIMLQTMQFIKENYGTMNFNCKQYDLLYELMTHDKKNSSGVINFTLLADIGDIRINQTVSKEEILDMLDFYRES